MFKKLLLNIKKYRWLLLFLFILATAIFAPSLKAGICLTDEIELRLNNMKGYAYASQTIINVAMEQGRVTNALPFLLFANPAFFNNSTLFFRGISAIIILFNLGVISFFLYTVTENRKYSLVCFISLLAWLPFTFEHMIPNGFVAFLGVPFSLLFISYICFLFYLREKGKKWIIASDLCLLIVLCSYEAFIVYTPIFLLLAIWQSHSLKKFIVSFIHPLTTGVIYLVLYIVQAIAFPTGYGGNQLAFKSLKSSGEIIFNLFKTGIPGFFSMSNKYKYIYYGAEQTYKPAEALSEKIHYFINNGMSLRIFIIALSLLVLFTLLTKKYELPKNAKSAWIMTVALCYMFLPSFPVSLASAYQGKINENFFLALPVSYFIYTAGAIILATGIYELFSRAGFLRGRVIMCLPVVLLAIPIQVTSEKVLTMEKGNFEEYLFAEQMLGTATVRTNIEEKLVNAGDLYEILAMRPTYWELAVDALYGYHADFFNGYNPSGDTSIQWYDHDFFVLTAGGNKYVISDKPVQSLVLESVDGSQEVFAPSSGFYDNGLLVYPVPNAEGKHE